MPLGGLVSVSGWLLVCVYGWGSPGLAHRDAAGFSTVSCLFGEGWQERTWDVGSLLKHSSPYTDTPMSADGSLQGEDCGSPENRQGEDLRWPGLLDQGPLGTGALGGIQGFSIIFGPV